MSLDPLILLALAGAGMVAGFVDALRHCTRRPQPL
jgi:hypothetical protein